ncbi:MAG: hypothetical protein ACFFDW_17005 [Candidatus Thorarchaeota archaeon]
MAVENIWIIDSMSGICIFDWYLNIKRKTIDEQLVSGLLIAFKNFSSEAGLVDISAIEGLDKKLAYKSDDRFIIAGICHSKDYEPLINRTLLDLLERFRKKYKDLLDDGMTTDVSPFRTFDDDIAEALEGTTSARNVVTTLTGIIASLLIAALVFVGYFFLITPIQNITSIAIGDIIGLVYLLVGMLVGGFIAGLVAGERKFGIIAGSISIIPIIGLMVGFFFNSWGDLTSIIFRALLYLILFGALASLGGLFGGYLKESKFFVPPADELLEDLEDENFET